MNEIISKELLSEVLKVSVLETKQNGRYIEFYSTTTIPYCIFGDTYNSIYKCYVQKINIYELQHLCKEWANNKDYDLNSNTYSALESGMCGSVTFKEYEEYLTTIKG